MSVSKVESAMHDMLHSEALVLCNPVTSSIPDTDAQSQQQQPEVHLREFKVASSAEDSKACKGQSDFIENPEHNTCTGHHGNSSALYTVHFFSVQFTMY